MPAGVVIAEAPSGRVVLANEQMHQIRCRPHTGADDGLEFDIEAFRDKDGRPYLPHEWPLVRSLAKGEVVKNEEVRLPREGGECDTMFVSSAPIRDPGGTIVAAVLVLYDITAQSAPKRPCYGLTKSWKAAWPIARPTWRGPTNRCGPK